MNRTVLRRVSLVAVAAAALVSIPALPASAQDQLPLLDKQPQADLPPGYYDFHPVGGTEKVLLTSKFTRWSTASVKAVEGSTVTRRFTVQRQNPDARVILQARSCTGSTGCTGSWSTVRVLRVAHTKSASASVTYTVQPQAQQIRVRVVGASGAVSDPVNVFGVPNVRR